MDASDKETAEARAEELYNAEELNRLIQNAEPGFYKSLIFTTIGLRHGEALALLNYSQTTAAGRSLQPGRAAGRDHIHCLSG